MERAPRVAALVDAAAYFDALSDALGRAERQVLVLGWDLHSRCPVGRGRGEADGGREETLVELLDRVTRARRELRVHLLAWDPAPIYVFERELLPTLAFERGTGDRVTLHLDDDHPLGGSHHQKVVVVDDRIAFAGGIDLTLARWDTRAHRPRDPRRVLPNGETYAPFHDAQLAVDGPVAAALGELARTRWERATGERLPTPDGAGDPWPDGLAPDLRDVCVGIARTEPAHDGREPVREVERLFLDAIEGADRTLYVENQYLSSRTVAEALEASLARREGPEIVLVTPRTQSGRLEQSTMGVLRARALRDIRRADHGDRLRVLSPVVPGDVGVNVHAKVLVVDDALLRVGSANLSERSMGLDGECDLAVVGDDEASRAAIRRVRDGLLAEHLGVEVDEVRREIDDRGGSLVAAVDALRGGDRTLVPLEPEVDALADAVLPDAAWVDPDRGLDEVLGARARRLLGGHEDDDG